MSQYLSEAFKRLDALNEETFSITDNGLEDYVEFQDNDELDTTIDVIDMEAETEEDLEDSYVGKVILDCCVCHSKLYKDVEDVVIDGEFANTTEECPFCYTTDGYKVIGQVASFGEDEEEKKDDKEDPAEEETPKDESLKENIKRRNRKPLKEGVDSNIYSAVGRHYKYNLPSNTAEVITDLVERAIDNYDSTSEVLEAVVQAIDEGLIYSSDIWAIKAYYESAELSDETYGELYNDIYSIVESLIEEDVNESKIRRPHKTVKESDRRNPNRTVSISDSETLKEDRYTRNLVKRMKALSNGEEVPNTNRQSKRDTWKVCQRMGMEMPVKTGFTRERDAIDYVAEHGGPSKLKVVKESMSDVPNVTGRKRHPKTMKESYVEVDTIECGEETYRVIGGGLNTRNALVSVEDDKGNTKRLSSGDVIEFYTWYDRNGNVVHEPSDLDESKSIKESVNNVNVETDDGIVNVSSDETGRVTVTTEPNTSGVSDTEVITPLEPEVQSEISDNVGDGEEIEIDMDEFDEESFDELGEGYLKKVYENVNSFKTSNVSFIKDKLILEGVIKFNSGSSKKTNFIFGIREATKSGKVRFIGENKEIARGRKSFTVTGRVENKKFLSESLNYNYGVRTANGKAQRLYGTVKNKRGK